MKQKPTENICVYCKEYISQFPKDDPFLCIQCFHLQEILKMEKKIQDLENKIENQRLDYEQAILANDLKNIIHRAYCPGCDDKLRNLSKKEQSEYKAILKSTTDKKIKTSFRKILKNHLKEEVK